MLNYDYSIEEQKQRIQNPITKRYFNEVYQTFVNENYRPSIVMLYSVLICDLVFKLRDLRDLFSDTKAMKILEEIEQLQSSNPKSPDWETKLIILITERTSLFEPADNVAIENLQKLRHLSAHPILSSADILFSPTKENVQSAIRSVLEGILTKPPFFSNKVFEFFLNDIAEAKKSLNTEEDLQRYVQSRYLSRFKENDIKKIFRSLWRVVFVSEDELSDENREINYWALNTLLYANKEMFIDLIRNEKGYYNNITKEKGVKLLINTLSRHSEIFMHLEDPLRLIINNHVETHIDSKIVAWFLEKTFKTHLEKLRNISTIHFSLQTLTHLERIAAEHYCAKEFNFFIIELWGKSGNFYSATQRFDSFILPILEADGLEYVEMIIDMFCNNNQIYFARGIKPRLLEIYNSKYNGVVDVIKFPILFN